MECLKSNRAIAALVDAAEPREAQEMMRHVDACPDCAETVNDYRRVRESLRSLPVRKPSADLTTALRVIASHERKRRHARLTFAHSFAAWRDRAHLTLKNLMQPLALPVAGGLSAAMLLFGVLVPDLTFEVHPIHSDVPTGLFTSASVKDVYWPTIGEADIVVDLMIDDQGRFTDYTIVSGGSLLRDESTRRRFESSLLLTQFTPATSFGQPTSGRVRVSFRTSRIDIKG